MQNKLPSVPAFAIRGSPRTMGRMLGEQAAGPIRSMLADYQAFIRPATGLSWTEAQGKAHEYLPYAQDAFPEYVDEVAGIAEGAGVSFADAWLMNCYESVAHDRNLMACTTIAANDDVTADGHVYLAHNEDWISVDREHVYLVHATPDHGPPFLAMSYGPLLPNVGLNAAGIAVGINSVYPRDVRVGVPRGIAARAILAAERLSDAIDACLPPRRAGGYSFVLADRSGEMFAVESSAAAHDLIYAGEGWLVHANHYHSPRLQALEEPGVLASSHVRQHRGERLVRGRLGDLTAESLQAILCDHVSEPDSICRHEDGHRAGHDRHQTIVSLVMDVTHLVVWAAPGPPCAADYLPFRLFPHPAPTQRLAYAVERDPEPLTPREAARAVLGLVDGGVAPET